MQRVPVPNVILGSGLPLLVVRDTLPPIVTEALPVIDNETPSVPVLAVEPFSAKFPTIVRVPLETVSWPPLEPLVLVRPAKVILFTVVLLLNVGQLVVEVPGPITTSSPEPGTVPELQFEAVPQFVLVPPVQLIDAAETGNAVVKDTATIADRRRTGNIIFQIFFLPNPAKPNNALFIIPASSDFLFLALLLCSSFLYLVFIFILIPRFLCNSR
jgi:hypothetical protein